MNELIEEWRDIEGYEGLYEISSIGRVKTHQLLKDRIMSPSTCGKGYLLVVLCKKGNKERKMIHRIVAETFIPNPNKEKTVNHKDGNKRNNSVENLEWCSYSENLKHAYKLGLNSWNPKKGRKQMPVIKMDLETLEILGEYCSIGEAYRSIEKYKGKKTRYDAISRCCKGEYKSAHGYFWKFKESED